MRYVATRNQKRHWFLMCFFCRLLSDRVDSVVKTTSVLIGFSLNRLNRMKYNHLNSIFFYMYMYFLLCIFISFDVYLVLFMFIYLYFLLFPFISFYFYVFIVYFCLFLFISLFWRKKNKYDFKCFLIFGSSKPCCN